MLTLRLVADRRRSDGGSRFFSDYHTVELPEIAVIEKPANQVPRDQLSTERVKLMFGRELYLSSVPDLAPLPLHGDMAGLRTLTQTRRDPD